MEKIKLNQEYAEIFVKDALELIGYPEILNITTYVNHEGKLRYEVYYEKDSLKHIKPLHQGDIISLIILGMSLKGYGINSVFINLKDDEIVYEVICEMASSNDLKRSRKK